MNSGSIHHGRSFPNCKVVNLRSMVSMDPLPQPGSFQLVEVTLRMRDDTMVDPWLSQWCHLARVRHGLNFTKFQVGLGIWAPRGYKLWKCLKNYGFIHKEFFTFRFESEYDIKVLLKLNLIRNSSFAYVSR